MPFYGVRYPYIRAEPYAPQMTREQEPDFLRSQPEAIKRLPVQIDARIKELEEEQRGDYEDCNISNKP